MILDTRPAQYRARTAAAYAGAPVPVVHWPIQTARPTAVAWPDPAKFDAILFTSQAAVALMPPGWTKHIAYVVGEGTEQAALSAGMRTVICTGRDGADMSRTLAAAAFRRAFYPSAKTVSVDLALAFPEKVERRAVYRMVAEERVPEAIAAKIRGRNVIAPLFSRQSGDLLARLLTTANLGAAVDAVGISAAVFEGPPGPWRQKVIARLPTLQAVAEEVLRLARELRTQ
jgi:uroporphyrinogen-III synthase